MTLREKLARHLFVLALLFGLSQAFYLPGVAPHDYADGEEVPLYVNSLTPMSNSQVKSVISYDYYFERLHFCQPKEGLQKQAESLGSILFGDRIFTSPFQLNMGRPSKCNLLCVTDKIPSQDAEFINELITDGYGINGIVDGLPLSYDVTDEHTGETFSRIGFELGTLADRKPALNNHLVIDVRFHKRPDGKNRVVGVLVYPSSKDHTLTSGETKAECTDKDVTFHLKADGNDRVAYTYDVIWTASNTAWATRWDSYLHILDPSIHWFSLVNSIVIVLFLTGMVAMILLRALHKDISRYNAVEAQEDVQEDYGWKLVHGDVFRPPTRPMLLSVLVGSGSQLIAMTGLTLVFAILGFLSPSNRGSLGTMMVIFFMIFSCISGFTSARIYKMNGGEAWKMNILMSATLFPGVIMGGLIGLNFFLIGSDSSGAVPFGTMLALLGLWALIALPLNVAGSYIGFRKPRIEHPVRTNQIPRQIPDQPVYLKSLPSILMGGILPFCAIFIELYFVMNSIWFHRIYYGIGFLFLVFGVLLLTCAQVTVLMCYFHLCNEDYHWSWRAFLTSGACGLYVYLYSILYYLTKLEINTLTSTILYLGYSAIISLLLALLTGATGYMACLFFLRKIFSSIKKATMTDISLVVLQHGLWGKSSHMNYIEQSFSAQFKNDSTVIILNSKVNEGKYTYDGIDLCGQRLADKIRSSVKELAKDKQFVKKLNMVGYSLGGLIARYAIGLLDQEGFFNDDVKPGFYVTFATPHMGVRRPKTSLFSRIFNFCSGHLVSRTGEQLQLIDKFVDDIPLLVVLASPDQPYYQALQKFDTIRTYANIKNDRTVPYWTAAMMTGEYFDNLEGIDLAIDQGYPSIVTGCDVLDKSKKAKEPRRESMSTKLRKALFYTLFPIFFPVFILFAFIYIGTQGMLSRYRVSKLLKASLSSSIAVNGPTLSTSTFSPPSPTLPTTTSLSDKGIDRHQSAELLSGALDAININVDDDGPTEHKSSHPLGTWCNVEPSESLKKRSAQYLFDSHVVEIQKNLSNLPWQIVLVCLHSFNAHGSIVCRQGIHTTTGGKAVIKHFLDTVPV